jgi:hypothetical protein
MNLGNALEALGERENAIQFSFLLKLVRQGWVALGAGVACNCSSVSWVTCLPLILSSPSGAARALAVRIPRPR